MKEHFEIKDHGHEHEHGAIPVVPEPSPACALLPIVALMIGLHWWRQVRNVSEKEIALEPWLNRKS